MNIKVSDKSIGNCNITSNNKLEDKDKCLIKSLCFIQLMCMDQNDDNDKKAERVKIIQEATIKLKDLYNEQPTCECNAVSQFI